MINFTSNTSRLKGITRVFWIIIHGYPVHSAETPSLVAPGNAALDIVFHHTTKYRYAMLQNSYSYDVTNLPLIEETD